MSETEKVVELALPPDQLRVLINRGMREPLLPIMRMRSLIPAEPGDEQKCEEIEDLFTPEVFETVENALLCLLDDFGDFLWVGYVALPPRDYNTLSARPEEDHFIQQIKFHVPRESIPGIRKCLELAVASHGPGGWMGRCLLHLEAKFAALEGA